MANTPALSKALREEIKGLRDQLAELTGKLDTVDHDAARDVQTARSNLFAAWSKLKVWPVRAGPIAHDVMGSINVAQSFRPEVQDFELMQRERSCFGRTFAALVTLDLTSQRMTEIATAQDNARICDNYTVSPLQNWRDARDMSKWVEPAGHQPERFSDDR